MNASFQVEADNASSTSSSASTNHMRPGNRKKAIGKSKLAIDGGGQEQKSVKIAHHSGDGEERVLAESGGGGVKNNTQGGKNKTTQDAADSGRTLSHERKTPAGPTESAGGIMDSVAQLIPERGTAGVELVNNTREERLGLLYQLGDRLAHLIRHEITTGAEDSATGASRSKQNNKPPPPWRGAGSYQSATAREEAARKKKRLQKYSASYSAKVREKVSQKFQEQFLSSDNIGESGAFRDQEGGAFREKQTYSMRSPSPVRRGTQKRTASSAEGTYRMTSSQSPVKNHPTSFNNLNNNTANIHHSTTKKSHPPMLGSSPFLQNLNEARRAVSDEWRLSAASQERSSELAGKEPVKKSYRAVVPPQAQAQQQPSRGESFSPSRAQEREVRRSQDNWPASPEDMRRNPSVERRRISSIKGHFARVGYHPNRRHRSPSFDRNHMRLRHNATGGARADKQFVSMLRDRPSDRLMLPSKTHGVRTITPDPALLAKLCRGFLFPK